MLAEDWRACVKATLWDSRACQLGEGPLWHPDRNTLFWFDIPQNRLLWRSASGPGDCALPESFSAAARVDQDHLIMASETGLWLFDIANQSLEKLCALDAENPITRSNDGRADPFGGFWIGSMGKGHEPGVAGIWRYFKGELRQLFHGLTVANSLCFSPDGDWAYFTDTPTCKVMRVRLDRAGWPKEPPELFLDLSGPRLFPDGAVTDLQGRFWVALWNSYRVSVFEQGREIAQIPLPAKLVACPAFGGPELSQLFITTARTGLSEKRLNETALHGMTFRADTGFQGRAEPCVLLG